MKLRLFFIGLIVFASLHLISAGCIYDENNLDYKFGDIVIDDIEGPLYCDLFFQEFIPQKDSGSVCDNDFECIDPLLCLSGKCFDLIGKLNETEGLATELEDLTSRISKIDMEGDGINNTLDNCPSNANSNQADQDNDGLGDVCDDDRDGDGINNTLDNCPSVANANQADEDEDGEGDACQDEDDEEEPEEYTPSSSSLSRGYKKLLREGDKIIFFVNKEKHTMTLLKIKRNYVLVEIKSTVFETELYVLEESKFDIIKDGYYDISVLLNSISSGRASITITTLHEKIIGEDRIIVTTTATPTVTLGENEEDSSEEGPNKLMIILAIIIVIIIIIVLFFLIKESNKINSEKDKEIKLTNPKALPTPPNLNKK